MFDQKIAFWCLLWSNLVLILYDLSMYLFSYLSSILYFIDYITKVGQRLEFVILIVDMDDINKCVKILTSMKVV